MTEALPAPIAAYFSATTPDEIADCFEPDGVALDERRTHEGREAILRWREEVGKISFTQELLSSQVDGNEVKVTCRVSGNFKGSPVNLDYAFRLSGNRIARLEIS